MIIIGEKINGSIPIVAEAIAKRDSEFIKERAKLQAESGATYIDCCASVPEAEEVETLKWMIDCIQEVTDLPTVPKEAYPDGITVLSPIETWSDDFSMAIAGIPSTVNDFSAGPFMQNYYHSQYDNQDVYQEAVYQFHHECYLKLIMAIDRLVLPPMNFSNTMNAVAESIHENALSFADPEQNVLLRNLQTITASAENIYDKICQINAEYATLSDSDARIAFRHKWEYAGLELLKTFRKAQDYLVRLNWQDEVIFPQEAASKNIRQLEKASRALSEGNITDALKALYRVDNNMYAFLFDEEVYYHFTEYILHQPKDRLMWGAGRIMHHENLYGIVQKLKQRMEEETPELDSEIRRLEAALRRQKAYYKLTTDGWLIKEDPSLKTFWNFIQGKDYLNSSWTDQLHQTERLHVIYLAVDPGHQHHGLAELLMDEVINYAQKHKMLISLETHNPNNVPIYEHFGFKTYGIVEKPHFGLKQYCMIREATV